MTVPFEVSHNAPMKSFYDFKVQGIDGKADLLAGLKGKVVLAVNVASRCGLTPQYTGLEELHEELAGENFSVVGFPCNQFGAQEPGTRTGNPDFLFRELRRDLPDEREARCQRPGPPCALRLADRPANGHAGDIEWNFEKFLIGRDGKLLQRYAPTVKPRDNGLMQDIAAAL